MSSFIFRCLISFHCTWKKWLFECNNGTHTEKNWKFRNCNLSKQTTLHTIHKCILWYITYISMHNSMAYTICHHTLLWCFHVLLKTTMTLTELYILGEWGHPCWWLMEDEKMFITQSNFFSVSIGIINKYYCCLGDRTSSQFEFHRVLPLERERFESRNLSEKIDNFDTHVYTENML